MYWTPPLTSADVLLTSIPIPGPAEPLAIAPVHTGSDNTGRFAALGDGPSELHLSYLDPHSAQGVLCVVIPLNADMPDRIETVRRLWQLLQNHAAPDQRLTEERRRRLRLMLRAYDGKTAGATVRQIAEALYGGERVAEDLWSDSPLRYATLRLLRDAERMVQSGYRDLLRAATADKRRRRLPPAGVRT